MANCSYARCEQERRFIKRELQKWTKSMVFIVGLERVAEELMGRRKWKLYQEVIASSHLNSNSTVVTTNTLPTNSVETEIVLNNRQNSPYQSPSTNTAKERNSTTENPQKESDIVTIKKEQGDGIKDQGINCRATDDKAKVTCVTIKSEAKIEQNHCSVHSSTPTASDCNKLPIPVDWKPQEKCYFCIDGKLLTVNDRGELVAESGPVNAEPDLANQTTIDSESESSECSDSEIQTSSGSVPLTKTVTDLLKHSLPQQSMTSFESMAAQLATIASLNGFPPMYPGILYNPFVHQMHTATAEQTTSDNSSVKPSSTSSEMSTEQPLDLSSKPTNSTTMNPNDPKQVFRAKPRMSTVAGRRTYTEEELQSALQDILSGKLGTRRAAVLYGIPRSTLRNKVYKLAMEQKREASLIPPANVLDVLDQEEEEKELSGGEEDKDTEKTIKSSVLTPESLLSATRSSIPPGIMPKFGTIYDSVKSDVESKDTAKTTCLTPDTPPIATNPWLDPVVLQNLILAGGFMQQKYDDAGFQELFRNLLIQQQELMKEHLKSSINIPNDNLNNGKPLVSDPRHLTQNLSLLHHQVPNRNVQSETPETVISADTADLNDDSAVILKIPSFKPVAGTSSASTKNGESASDKTPQTTTSPMLSRSPHLPGISSPILRPSNDSQSPPINVGGKSILSLRDVIAKSITRTFNQSNPESAANKSSVDCQDQYKRPSISVIKSLGNTDMTRFGSSPNIMTSVSSHNSNSQSVSANAGGKGTRPKRGKYRNYDRDSLVEAVKAVQRGEMSVHRAGSYYGVPHSTLEYKVKERHLMRPRKREPKPQPLDGTSGGSITKSADISGTSSTSIRAIDKSKPISTTKPPLNTPPRTFPATSPNGLKVGMFDPNQLQYAPHLFWPHPPGYTGLPMDFTRGTTCSASTFTTNAENFFASQMMQRFQEDAMRQTGGTASSSSGGKSTSNSTNQSKVARDMSESFYETHNTNGSFLDGIIRHSLDRKSSDIPHGVLLDQLVKNNRHSEDGNGTVSSGSKRSGSPLNFAQTEIKRERTSPSSADTDRDSIDRDISKESVENLLKYRDGLTLRSDEKSLRNSIEDVNGDSPSDHKLIVQTQSENEDSS